MCFMFVLICELFMVLGFVLMLWCSLCCFLAFGVVCCVM